MNFKNKNLYSYKERLDKNLQPITRKDTSIAWIWLIAIVLIIFTQYGSHTPANADTQEQKVKALLEMPVLEDYSNSIGRLTFNLSAPEPNPWIIYDLDRLADAVATYETSYCTNKNSPTANARNNCWGIMTWKRGYRELKTYNSIEDGKEDFKRIWSKSYGGMPNLAKARKYSGNDRASTWLNEVLENYKESYNLNFK